MEKGKEKKTREEGLSGRANTRVKRRNRIRKYRSYKEIKFESVGIGEMPNKTSSPSSPSASRSWKRRPTRRRPSSSLLAPLYIEPPPNFFPSRVEFLQLASVIAIAAAVAAFCTFISGVYNRHPIPFCDSDLDIIDLGLDTCVPCPSHGRCHQGQLRCDQGYKRHGKICLEDGDVENTAKKLSERAENQLCAAYAQFMCYGSGSIWVCEEELENYWDNFFQEEHSSLDYKTYVFAKGRAMEKIDKLLETRLNPDRVKEFKCPDPVAESYKPISCRVRQWVAKHSLFLMSVCALLGMGMCLLSRVRRRWYLSKRAENLYQQVCDILEEKAVISKNMNGREPWVVSSRLRDHVLSPQERRDQELWKKVEQLMGEDSRLECYPKLVKGESKVVWEWQVEGSLSSFERRKKAGIGRQKSSADENASRGKENTWRMEPKALVF